jgi:hypothetical protein
MTEQSPEHQKGPKETRIDWIWDQAWAKLSNGEIYDYFVALAEADLAKFERDLAPNDPSALTDLTYAKSSDRAQRTHFAAVIKQRDEERQRIYGFVQVLHDQVIRQSHFVMQSLALANGSVVLATLGYIGRDGASPVSRIFIVVIGLGGVGFLLTLLMAHVGVMRSRRPLKDLAELAAPRISEERAKVLGQGVLQYGNQSLRISSIIGYAAALCLILALATGTVGLL